MDLKKTCPDKLIGAETAMSKIKNGSRVFIGSGCGEPQHLIRTMVEDLNMQDIMLYQMLSVRSGSAICPIRSFST